MLSYKSDFIKSVLESKALFISDSPEKDKQLKNRRMSSWFFNTGRFDNGMALRNLGNAFSQSLINSEIYFDILYGIPEKGIPLSISTSMRLTRFGYDIPFFFTRKFPKEHGEATNLSNEEKIKSFVVGRAPKTNDRIAQIDDVFTSGTAKYEARQTLESLGDFKYPVLAIAVDRQEVDENGNNAIEQYEKDTGTKVVSVISASDIYNFFSNHSLIPSPFSKEALDRMGEYIQKYGTEEAKRSTA